MKYLLLIVSLAVTLPTLHLFGESVAADLATQSKEGECIAHLVSQGVERINIATSNGNCWVETNGYYN